MEKEEAIYIYFRECLLRLSAPYNIISYDSLKTWMGRYLHIPKGLKYIMIKDLIEHNVLKPNQEKKWYDFQVIK